MPDDQTPDEEPEFDRAEQAMGEDGFTNPDRWMPQQMRHPVFKPTREYLAQHPLPSQKNRRTAA